MSLGKHPPLDPGDLKPRATATVVARGTTLTGQVEGSGAVRVEGVVMGSLHLDAPADVAEGARVRGEIHATTVRIAGLVEGDIHAREMVELTASASVTGDVHTPALHVIEGATLEGHVHMLLEGPVKGTSGKPAQTR